jgi:hypothetical protein
MNNYLGTLSKKYESGNSGPGTIARNAGDIGGASYGTYQIATKTGTMATFIKFLKTSYPLMYATLSKFAAGTVQFDAAWIALAKTKKDEFDAAQHEFIKSSHYEPAVNKIKQAIGLDVNQCSLALQNVVWSTAVQHGSGGACNIFKNAGIKSEMKDEEIIRLVYAERGENNGLKYFGRSSNDIRQSVINRFNKELKDALEILATEKTKIYVVITDPITDKDTANKFANGTRKAYGIIVHVMTKPHIYLKTGSFTDKQKAQDIAKGIKKAYGVNAKLIEQ